MHAAPFSCKTYTRAFQSEEMYRKHIEDKHKPIHLCSTRGKTFWKRSVLVKHTALHTLSGKPHKCPYQQCGKEFASRELLADHVNSHTHWCQAVKVWELLTMLCVSQQLQASC